MATDMVDRYCTVADDKEHKTRIDDVINVGSCPDEGSCES